jgi:PAS domain S-box-containing protein
MERKHLEKEPEAETPLPHVRRATSMPARASPPAQGQRAREGNSNPSARRDGKRSSWTGAGFAMNPPGKMPDVLKRYGVALVLAGLALFLRGALPLLQGTAIYQLPIAAAVVLSAWYGGRGPGLFASLICATGILYWFIPPVKSFELAPDHALAFYIFIALCLVLIELSAGRKRVEAKLQSRQEMLDLAQTAASAVAFDWYIGTHERENDWSPELEAMYGLERGTFDRTYEGWKTLVHPDDWPAVELAIRRAHESGDVAAEYRVTHKNGAVHWLRAKGRMLFDSGGRPERMVGFMIDVTDWRHAEEELRASEGRFRTLVEFAADGFMLHAADTTVVDVNRQACENLGYSREELIGMKPIDFDAVLDPEALQRVSDLIGSGDIVTVETRHRRKDGSVFPVELRLRQVLQGGRRYTISMARDITERKHVEEERDKLHRLETELARVSRLTTLGELTTSIAHEVSQPLGGMVASAGACARWLAAAPPAMAEARAALDNIVADGKRAREVIARIRTLTKRQVPRKDRLDINHQVREVLALTDHELGKHDIVLRTELDGTLPPLVGDRVQLQQVLLNLIVNAVEAMSTVHDRARELAIVSRLDGSNAVLVEVRDSGIGLDAQRAEQVFEAFYTTKPEGIGIGLSISRSIIEAHGGRLWVSANAPHGAVFRFSLPVTDEAVS